MGGSMAAIGSPTKAPGVVVGGFDKFGNELRIFNDSGIQKQIDQAVAQLKPEDHGAIVAVVEKKSDEVGTVRLAGVVKPFGSDKFTVVGFLGHDLNEDWKKWDVSGAVRLRF